MLLPRPQPGDRLAGLPGGWAPAGRSADEEQAQPPDPERQQQGPGGTQKDDRNAQRHPEGAEESGQQAGPDRLERRVDHCHDQAEQGGKVQAASDLARRRVVADPLGERVARISVGVLLVVDAGGVEPVDQRLLLLGGVLAGSEAAIPQLDVQLVRVRVEGDLLDRALVLLQVVGKAPEWHVFDERLLLDEVGGDLRHRHPVDDRLAGHQDRADEDEADHRRPHPRIAGLRGPKQVEQRADEQEEPEGCEDRERRDRAAVRVEGLELRRRLCPRLGTCSCARNEATINTVGGHGHDRRRACPAALALDDPLAAQSRRMLRPMPEFAVTAIGRDRPGIVAAISGALLELEGNIEDSQMSILRGHFAVMLIVKLPEAAGRGRPRGRASSAFARSSSWRRSP